MKVRLNLATRPLLTHRRFLAGSSLLGVASLAIFIALGVHVVRARRANAEMRAKIADISRQVDQLQRQRKRLEDFFKLPENAQLHDRAAFINGLIDARSFNWTQMFMDLEDLLPSGVRVVSIEPKQEKGRIEVKLTVGASSDEAKLKLLKALEESKSFSDIQVNAVRLMPAIGSADPILVELTAQYARI
jgi:type IV pilus assembly protein PilN